MIATWRARYPFLMKLASSSFLLSIMVLLTLKDPYWDAFRSICFTFIAYFLVYELISIDNHRASEQQAQTPDYDGRTAYSQVTSLVFVWLLCVSYVPGLMGQVCILALASAPLMALNQNRKLVLRIVFHVFIPLAIMRFAIMDKGEHRFLYLWPLVVAQICDWGGFVFGTLLKKAKVRTHRLTEISPSKTREGTAAALLFSIGAGVFCFPEHPFVMGALSAVIAGVSISGDLYESLLKRRAFVKDAGYILFDHGGMLDRFDSWLFAAYTIPLLMALVQSGIL